MSTFRLRRKLPAKPRKINKWRKKSRTTSSKRNKNKFVVESERPCMQRGNIIGVCRVGVFTTVRDSRVAGYVCARK